MIFVNYSEERDAGHRDNIRLEGNFISLFHRKIIFSFDRRVIILIVNWHQ